MRKLIVADAVRTAAGVSGNAVLVDGGHVVAVGAGSDLQDGTVHEERYPGAYIAPGLRDAHLHPTPYAALLRGVQLKDATDIADVLDRLRDAANRPGPVIAMRLDDESLAERRLPTRRDLDAAVSDRPVIAHRYCGHIAVANSAALRRAGIDASTPDPEGGTIDRDGAGNPTGVLRETAIELVSTTLDASVEPDDLLQTVRGLAGIGITSIGAMLGTGEDGPWASLGDETELFAEIARSLPIKVHAFVIADDPARLERARATIDGRGAYLRFAGVKRFSDGSLGGHTAAMCEPFADRPDTAGTNRLTAADAAAVAHTLADGGIACVHAIGDGAVASVLDLFEGLVAAGHRADRMRIEHASVMTSSDIERAARLGVILCVQPAFLGSEAGWLEKRLGAERLARTYPFGSLERAGALLAGGSDCPVEPPHPLWGMALARDRAGIVPEEALGPTRALALFTSGAARALGEPAPLAPGNPADLIVLDRDPVASSPGELRAARVIDTFVDGDTVIVDRTIATWTS